ncbi:MAG: DNA-3-methyladenine glycosylase I [Phascolarctobacterium sp.]|nr:DNA-3-methyladenine glycosylase I [Phascolarctobacterium sp.]
MTIINRCFWANPKNPLYLKYHDKEWGVPQHNDKVLFEMLVLEFFQAGLSWECILNKRAAFCLAFDDFNAEKISKYDDAKIEELLQNSGIIRNRLKIKAAVNNAKIFLDIQKEFGSFDAYIWKFTNGAVIQEPCDLRTTSPLSDTISKDLKKRGMKFVGSTVIYSYLQAIGVIFGHLPNCDCFKKIFANR